MESPRSWDEVAALLSQCSREAEFREDAAVGEPGDGGELVPREREHEERAGTGDGGVWLGPVTAERRQSIRARRHDAQRPRAALLGHTQRGADDGGAVVRV